MRFLCDMCVSLKVVDWLPSQGHDTVHLRDEGLQRLPNGEIFTKAVSERRIIVTFDLDFGEIAAMSQGRVAGVIIFRLRNPRAKHVIERLSTVLLRAAEALQRGAIVAVEESRLRIREWPIGGES